MDSKKNKQELVIESTESVKKKKVLKITLLTLFIIFLLIFAYGIFLLLRVGNIISSSYLEIEQENLRAAPLELGEDPFSLLVLGIDQPDLARPGHSDAIMLMTFNPEKESTYILSLARDKYIDVTGHGVYFNRLGFQYTLGGAAASVDALQRTLNLPVDYFVVVDMLGFSSLIDEIGGITINNTLEFSVEDYDFPIGPIDLDGSQALSFVRMRMDDPDGDFGRQERQRAVAETTLRSLARVALLRHHAIINILGDSLQTNLTSSDLLTIFWNYRGALEHIELLELRGTSELIDDVHFHVVPDEQILEMSEHLKGHLELDN